MGSVTLSYVEIAGVVFSAVALAASDPAALSRIATTALAKRAGLKPRQIREFSSAADGDDSGSDGGGN